MPDADECHPEPVQVHGLDRVHPGGPRTKDPEREARPRPEELHPRQRRGLPLLGDHGFLQDAAGVRAKNGEGNESNIGILKLKLGDELIINDGQHRCAGIAAALKENPEIGDHTIAVLLFNYENKERVQQMFSDLNRFVVKTSKSLDILYDKRDKISAATIAFLDQVPLFKNLTEKDDSSLRSKSTKLFTLAALYDANRELLKGKENDDVIENANLLKTYWAEVAKHMPDWNSVFTEHKTAVELRAEKIASHSTVLRALGGLGAEMMKDPNWHERLGGLETIDWSKQNKDWENVCIIANSVVSNRQARAATKAYIKAKLQMELTDGEKRALEPRRSGIGPVRITQ